MSRATRLVGVLMVVGATSGGALVVHAAELGSDPASAHQRADRVRIPPAPPSPERRLAEATVAAVNAERSRQGLAPFQVSEQAMVAANRHSVDMARRQRLDHRGSDGSNAGDRLTAAGFSWRSWGENIAAGFTDPNTVVVAWLNSPGHRATLLGNYQFVGVGVAATANGTLYWTLDAAS